MGIKTKLPKGKGKGKSKKGTSAETEIQADMHAPDDDNHDDILDDEESHMNETVVQFLRTGPERHSIIGATENAGVENAIRSKLQGWKMQEWKKQEWIVGVENAGVENAGVDNRGRKCRSKLYGNVNLCSTRSHWSAEVHKRKLGKLILRKIIKIIATRCHILKPKCIKFDFCWGGEAYSWI